MYWPIIQQQGQSEALEKIKKKVFGRSFRLPQTSIQALDPKEDLQTFASARAILRKNYVEI